jgi:hypothetical protein
MKCEGRLYLAALLLGVPFFWTPFAGTPMARTVDVILVLDNEKVVTTDLELGNGSRRGRVGSYVELLIDVQSRRKK